MGRYIEEEKRRKRETEWGNRPNRGKRKRDGKRGDGGTGKSGKVNNHAFTDQTKQERVSREKKKDRRGQIFG